MPVMPIRKCIMNTIQVMGIMAIIAANIRGMTIIGKASMEKARPKNRKNTHGTGMTW